MVVLFSTFFSDGGLTTVVFFSTTGVEGGVLTLTSQALKSIANAGRIKRCFISVNVRIGCRCYDGAYFLIGAADLCGRLFHEYRNKR